MIKPNLQPQIQDAASIESLAGSLERVTYHNSGNGFCVLKVKVRGYRELVTVVGSTPTVSPGETLAAQGTWFHDREHGRQFKAHQKR